MLYVMSHLVINEVSPAIVVMANNLFITKEHTASDSLARNLASIEPCTGCVHFLSSGDVMCEK